MIEITRRIEFDAGHRIPDHKSKCRNVHGHRYALEATIAGALQTEGSSKGMVQDFGDLKRIMMEEVGEPWDHAFLVWCGDTKMLAALETLEPGQNVVITTSVPTVENLVADAAQKIEPRLKWHSGAIALLHVRLYETPSCWADWWNPIESRGGLNGIR